MATFSGSLSTTEIKREDSPFTASFDDIVTNVAWKRPTTTKVDAFQTEWFASNDISSFDIWLCGSYRESLERTVDWAMWDVDYVINGDLNSDLVNLLESALTIGFKYELWVDALHWNIPPWDYATYPETKFAVTITKPYKKFSKEMKFELLDEFLKTPENQELLSISPKLEYWGRQIQDLNRRRNQIYEHPDLSSERKRELINELEQVTGTVFDQIMDNLLSEDLDIFKPIFDKEPKGLDWLFPNFKY